MCALGAFTSSCYLLKAWADFQVPVFTENKLPPCSFEVMHWGAKREEGGEGSIPLHADEQALQRCAGIKASTEGTGMPSLLHQILFDT